MSVATARLSAAIITTVDLPCPRFDADMVTIAQQFLIACNKSNCTYDSLVRDIGTQLGANVLTDTHVPRSMSFRLTDVILLLATALLISFVFLFNTKLSIFKN
jgi:hypothetical protein